MNGGTHRKGLDCWDGLCFCGCDCMVGWMQPMAIKVAVMKAALQLRVQIKVFIKTSFSFVFIMGPSRKCCIGINISCYVICLHLMLHYTQISHRFTSSTPIFPDQNNTVIKLKLNCLLNTKWKVHSLTHTVSMPTRP